MAKIVKANKKNQKITSKVKMKPNLSPEELELIKTALYDIKQGTAIPITQEELMRKTKEILLG